MIRAICLSTCRFLAVRHYRLLIGLAVLIGFVTTSSTAEQAHKHLRRKGHPPVGTPYVYKTVDGRKLHLYVLEPADTSSQPHPAIIFFHGGGWVALGPGAFNHQAEYLSARGMVAIEVEYRLLTGNESPQICVEDAKSSVRWVRSHAGQLSVDPNRIVESGGSAGGYLAAFASMVPGWNDPHDDLKVSAKADLLALYNPVIDNSPTGYGNKRFGTDYKRYSPFFYVTPDTPPTLIQSGSEDRLIHASVLEKLNNDLSRLVFPVS